MDSITVATTAVAFLAPYLVKAGEKAVEEVGKKLPGFAANMWNAITARFKGSPAAEETVQDFAAKPEDQLIQSAFANQLRKILEAQPAFTAELVRLIDGAQSESGDTIIVTGSGAAANSGGIAAGEGGVAVRGDVHGGIITGSTEKKG